MLVISFFIAVIIFLLLQIILDFILGPKVQENFLQQYYQNLRGEKKKTEKKFILSKVTNFDKQQTKMSKKMYIQYSLLMGGCIFLVGMIFLRSIPIALFLSLGGVFYPPYMLKKNLQKRRELLNIQLRDAMQSISNSLKVGSSLQNSIERCYEELKRTMKVKKDKPIVDEFETMVYELQIGKTLEEVLISFRDRVKMEDVDSFVNTALITKEKGGNLTEVMGRVAKAISDKIEVKREIMTLTASKRSEAKILTFMPAVVVIMLSVTSPTYMEPMYTTTIGKIMTIIGVLLLAANYFIGKKIIDIDV